jgi:hypothetical protein
MTLLGTVALIAVVILGILVLRVKSDPTENESVRKYLAESKQPDGPEATAESPSRDPKP